MSVVSTQALCQNKSKVESPKLKGTFRLSTFDFGLSTFDI